MEENKPKKCLFCGRFFVPDPRVGNRQKACHREQCQKERKKLAQFKWCRKNPKYFADRYEYVRSWRGNNTSRDVREEPVIKKPVKRKTVKKKAGGGNGGNGNGWYKG